MAYVQLTIQERYLIYHLNQTKVKPAVIARRLGRHRGTVGRELRRNVCPSIGDYFCDTAQRLATQRRDQANRRYQLDHSPVGQYVRQGLAQRWSPQQIAGRLRTDYPNDESMRVTPETIYRWVYRQHTLGETWPLQLRQRHWRRKRRIHGERASRGQILQTATTWVALVEET